jgi:lipopolysaccharide export system protein LptA
MNFKQQIISIYKMPTIKIKHIVLLGVLCFFLSDTLAQIRPGQLRNEIMQLQNPTPKLDSKKKKKTIQRITRPLNNSSNLAPIVNPLNTKNASLVYLENTQTLAFDQFTNPDVQILRGNVRFRHDGALLFCDSAYFYEKANSLDAFSNVRIVQGDTLFVYGDYLYYDGNLKLARMRQNVRLVNRETTLTTDSLDFDRNTNLAYYRYGGKIVDPENTLTSAWGEYNTSNSDALFRKNVFLTNKNFVMESDTLHYNTKTSIANIVGKTHILYQDETDIYSTRGWYNTEVEQMMLLDKSKIIHKDGKVLTGDTIYYDKSKKFGEGFINVTMNDTVKKNTLYGEYVYYNENDETGLATDSALLVDWSSADTLWVHADTLRTLKDSIYDVAKGYFNVRFFRNDVQGICDSLVYNTRDSIMNMHGEPVVWAEKNQLSGEFIQAFVENDKIKRIHIQQAAMAVQQEDSLYFNQLSGKEIIAHMDSGELRRVNVNGNAETIYYPRDDADSTLIGINKTESSFVVMYLKNKKVDRIVLTTASSGIMYPITELSGGDLYLKNYFWIEDERPTNSEDVMLTIAKKTREKIGTSSLMGKTGGGDENDAKSGSNDAETNKNNNTPNNSRVSPNNTNTSTPKSKNGMRLNSN